MKVHLGYPDNVEFPNKDPHAEYRPVHLLLPARLRLKISRIKLNAGLRCKYLHKSTAPGIKNRCCRLLR